MFFGGRMGGTMICLDFVNTVDDRLSDHPKETLIRYADFLDWAIAHRVIDGSAGKELKKDTAEPEEALQQARTLRELLYRMFSAVAGEESIADDDLRRFNGFLARAMSDAQIARTEAGYQWLCCAGASGLRSVIDPIVKSAADLLVSPQLERVRLCADPHCGWLFLDSSRNRSRRWCSMDSCGNRAKARRFYRRHQQQSAGEEN